MKLYFAGAESAGRLELPSMGVRRALVAYSAGPRACTKVHETYPEVLLDSGAYSAFTRGATINLDEYVEFIQSKQWDAYASLDVIGDAGATLANAERMIEAGLKPVVAFHHGSPYDVLEAMCQRFDHIALGGLVPIRMRKTVLREHLEACFHIIGKHWPVKVHGFGMQQPWALERYPFYSVDATSWMYGHAHSRMLMREDADGVWAHQTRRTSRANAERHARSSLAYATTVADAAGGDKFSATRSNVRRILDLERRMTKLWAARGITWKD